MLQEVADHTSTLHTQKSHPDSRAIINRGDMIPDKVVGTLLLEALLINACKTPECGVLVDGFPRTALQVGAGAARGLCRHGCSGKSRSAILGGLETGPGLAGSEWSLLPPLFQCTSAQNCETPCAHITVLSIPQVDFLKLLNDKLSDLHTVWANTQYEAQFPRPLFKVSAHWGQLGSLGQGLEVTQTVLHIGASKDMLAPISSL